MEREFVSGKTEPPMTSSTYETRAVYPSILSFSSF
jgi:hypothetical protein